MNGGLKLLSLDANSKKTAFFFSLIACVIVSLKMEAENEGILLNIIPKIYRNSTQTS